MKFSNNNKAITLIALVITIIILLILAGVAISTLTGDNGILRKAVQAKEETVLAGEIEQLQLLVLEYKKIGKELKQVYFNSAEDTTSIYDTETGETYADNWYYITPENAQEITLKNSYIVNYKTGDVVSYEEGKHRIVDNNLLCIKEGLVYTIDAKNRSTGDNWGDAILHNFNTDDENSGWTEKSLSFDGVDDGIEVPDKSDYSNGITIEMYLKLRGQTENQVAQILMMKRTNTANGFFLMMGNVSKSEQSMSNLYRIVSVDIGGVSERFITNTFIEENVPIYISYTYNPNAKDDNGVLYINGEKTETTNLGNVENIMEVQNTNIQIGSDVYITNDDGKDNRYPFKGEIYAARVYNRPLTEQEVKYNYMNTVNN